MGLKKLFGQLGGVVACPILHQEQSLSGLFQHLFKKCAIAFGIESSLNTLIKQAPTEKLDQSEHFVALAFATCFHHRLLTHGCPDITQRTPLGETGFVSKQQQPPGRFRLSFEVRKNLGHPQQTFGFVQMIGHKTGLLVGKPQPLEQFTQVMGIVQHPEFVPDQVLNQQTRPTPGGVTDRLRTCFKQLAQLFLMLLANRRRMDFEGKWGDEVPFFVST